MQLEALVKMLPMLSFKGRLNTEIRGISVDSRQVCPGDLFVAIKGQRYDGHHFVNEALASGACAFLLEHDLASLPQTETAIVVTDTQAALPLLTQTFYGCPSKQMDLVGVTGTNGKTTTTYLIESIFHAAGEKAGVLGTIDYHLGSKCKAAQLTTPDHLELQKTLRWMHDEGATKAVMEVSSHALALRRVAGISFTTAVFTNLGRDHLDFHPTLEDYFEQKATLFTPDLLTGSNIPPMAVINTDDPKGQILSKRIPASIQTISYGLHPHADISATSVQLSSEGISAILITPKGRIPIHSSLLGEHNLYNCLAASGAALAQGVELSCIAQGIKDLALVPGRLEVVSLKHSKAIPKVIIDYAHKPDAMDKVLQSLIPFKRKMITVFGCGGNRDRGKRPLMGQIAYKWSDFVVITSDNPRMEAPEEIISEICTGLETSKAMLFSQEQAFSAAHQGQKGYCVVSDRRSAINFAISLARSEDIVLVAGKGHETYQILGNKRIHFDDREEAHAALLRWTDENL